MEGFGPTRIRMRRRGSIQLALDPRDERLLGLRIGTRSAGWWHQPAAQLPRDFFPDVGMIADAREIQRLERQTANLGFLVVTADTVAGDHLARRGRVCRCGRL
jgi:hypothetical protein